MKVHYHKCNMKLSFALLLILSCQSVSGDLTYLSTPRSLWTTGGSEVKRGNGLFLTPDNSLLVGSFFDGSARFYDPSTGTEPLPRFRPTTTGFTLRGYGGMTFSYQGAKPYMVYAVTDDPFNPVNART